MKNCNKYLELLASGSFKALSKEEQEQIRQELENDPDCLKKFNSMDKTLQLTHNYKVPDPGEDYWETFYQRLDQKLNTWQDKKPAVVWPVIYKAAAFIAAGIFIGYLLFDKPADNKQINNNTIQQIALNRETADLLEDSKVLLLGIVNLDSDNPDAGKIDFSFQKEISGDLLKKTADLKQLLKDSPNKRVISLLSDLEMILMQITNLENEFDLPSIEIIKNGANEQSIMFKINMEKMLLDARMENREGNSTGKKREES
ncbi:MAG: hypothetical protein KDF60_07915 [Calditrichaeota bacterium]|nr:hypothetical protein [Calditrichota bacterium]